MEISLKSKFGDMNTDTITGLRNKFRNTPLWDYLKYAITFFFRESHSWDEQLFIDTRSGVRKFIDDTLQLALFMKSFKEGKASGRGWHLDARSDISCIYDSVESLFLEKLDKLPNVLHRYEWEEFHPELFNEWEVSLSNFPTS